MRLAASERRISVNATEAASVTRGCRRAMLQGWRTARPLQERTHHDAAQLPPRKENESREKCACSGRHEKDAVGRNFLLGPRVSLQGSQERIVLILTLGPLLRHDADDSELEITGILDSSEALKFAELEIVTREPSMLNLTPWSLQNF